MATSRAIAFSNACRDATFRGFFVGAQLSGLPLILLDVSSARSTQQHVHQALGRRTVGGERLARRLVALVGESTARRHLVEHDGARPDQCIPAGFRQRRVSQIGGDRQHEIEARQAFGRVAQRLTLRCAAGRETQMVPCDRFRA